jgi:hypothetical protein
MRGNASIKLLTPAEAKSNALDLKEVSLVSREAVRSLALCGRSGDRGKRRRRLECPNVFGARITTSECGTYVSVGREALERAAASLPDLAETG